LNNMENVHNKEEIIKVLSEIEFGAVSTLDGEIIKNRTMHFAVDEDLNFYLATLKGDPKVKQILENTSTSLLLVLGNKGFFEAKEIEVIGQAELINNKEDRKNALDLLEPRSPVVANMKQGGALDLLAVVKIKPITLKYRFVPEILRGIGPTIIDFEAGKKNAHYYFGWKTFKKSIAVWITEVRLPFLTASIIPVILGTAVAWAKNNMFDPINFILALFGVACLHAGTNMANDYFDHKRGNDEKNTEFVRPFSGGSRMIQKNLLKPAHVLIAAVLCFCLGSLIGLYFTWIIGINILILGLIGVFSGFFYSSPPFRLADRGLGEIFVGINFGILATLGSYLVQTGHLGVEPVLAAIPLSLLIAAVLYINEFPDYNADKEVGKNNLVVRFGKKKAVMGYVLLMYLVFISVAVLAPFGLISPWSLLIFLIFPRALRAIRVVKLNFNVTLYLIPANADTILCHLYGGCLLSLGYILQRLIL